MCTFNLGRGGGGGRADEMGGLGGGAWNNQNWRLFSRMEWLNSSAYNRCRGSRDIRDFIKIRGKIILPNTRQNGDECPPLPQKRSHVLRQPTLTQFMSKRKQGMGKSALSTKENKLKQGLVPASLISRGVRKKACTAPETWPLSVSAKDDSKGNVNSFTKGIRQKSNSVCNEISRGRSEQKSDCVPREPLLLQKSSQKNSGLPLVRSSEEDSSLRVQPSDSIEHSERDSSLRVQPSSSIEHSEEDFSLRVQSSNSIEHSEEDSSLKVQPSNSIEHSEGDSTQPHSEMSVNSLLRVQPRSPTKLSEGSTSLAVQSQFCDGGSGSPPVSDVYPNSKGECFWNDSAESKELGYINTDELLAELSYCEKIRV